MYEVLDDWIVLNSNHVTFRSKSQLQGKIRDLFVAFELPKTTKYTSLFHMVKGKSDVLSKDVYDNLVREGIRRFKAYSKVKYDAIVCVDSSCGNTTDVSNALSIELGIPVITCVKRQRSELFTSSFCTILEYYTPPCQKRYIPLVLEYLNVWLDNPDNNKLSVSEFTNEVVNYYNAHQERFGSFDTQLKFVHGRIKDMMHSVEVLDYIYNNIDLPRSVKVEDKWVDQKYLFVDDNINTGTTIKTMLTRNQNTLHKHATFFCLLGKNGATESLSSRVKMF